jgi:hypothetical protein
LILFGSPKAMINAQVIVDFKAAAVASGDAGTENQWDRRDLIQTFTLITVK